MTYDDVDMDPGAATGLMTAVLARAFTDALMPHQPFYGRPISRLPDETDASYEARSAQRHAERVEETNRPRFEAREWLLGDSPDFREIVESAGCHPETILKRARELAATGWEAAAELSQAIA